MVRQWILLFTTGKIARYPRLMALVPCIGLFIMGWDCIYNPTSENFSLEIYGRVQAMASLQLWGIGWWTASGVFLIAIITRSFAVYAAATGVALMLQSGWITAMLMDKIDGAQGTTIFLGLWFIVLFWTAGMALAPNPKDVSTPVLVKMDDQVIGEVEPQSLRLVTQR